MFIIYSAVLKTKAFFWLIQRPCTCI